MKTTTKIKLTLSILFLVFCAPLLIAQSIITIDNNPGSLTTYQTLQDAHDNAVAGDTIYVQPSGTSYGNLSITKPLTIIGRSPWETANVSSADFITIGSSNVTLKGLKIIRVNTATTAQAPNTYPFENLIINECNLTTTSGAPFSLVLGHDATTNQVPLALNNVQIKGNYIRGLEIKDDAANILLTNNIFQMHGSYGFRNFTTSNTVIITNNIIKQVGGFFPNIIFTNSSSNTGTTIVNDNIFLFNVDSGNPRILFNHGSYLFNNNLVYNLGTGIDPEIVVQNSANLIENNTLLGVDPLFTNIDTSVDNSFGGIGLFLPLVRPEDDFTLQPGSPAINGGLSGGQIGIYNNGFEFEKLGNPKGFPLIDVITYDTSVPKNGNINVTIQAKAN